MSASTRKLIADHREGEHRIPRSACPECKRETRAWELDCPLAQLPAFAAHLAR